MKDYIKFDGAKVLIAGGMGFIGSSLARRLVGLNADVTIIDSLIPTYGGNTFNIKDIEKKIQVNIADVRDNSAFKGLIKGQEYLFNLIGQTSHMDSMNDPYSDLEINCKAQLSMLEACRYYNPIIKVVFASTRQIYGKPDYLPVDEKHPLMPVDINGINKISGEWYHILYNNIYGIRSCILRLTNTYGPGMRVKDSRQTFVGIWIKSLVQGKAFEVWGGEQLRDFNYVDDVVDAMLLTATDERSYSQIFNLGGDIVISLKELAELVIELSKESSYEICPFPVDQKKIDIGDYYSDFGKIKSLLGWEPKISLREGFSRALAYYKKHLHYYL